MESRLQALKVPELKHLLQAAHLPVSGNKADLIARLLENPAATASLDSEAPAPAAAEPASVAPVEAAEVPAPTAQASTEAPAPAPPAGVEEVPAEPVDAGAAAKPEITAHVELTAEERKAAAVEELKRRLKRAEKFGAPEETVADIKAQIGRAEKFGVSEEVLKTLGIAALDSKISDGPRRRGPRGERNNKAHGAPRAAAHAVPAKAETVSLQMDAWPLPTASHYGCVVLT